MRTIIIELETDSADSLSEIERNIAMELGYCSTWFYTDTMRVYEKADTPQKDKEALLNDAYYRVFKDLTREDGFFTGIYDAKNGKKEFMYGISTVMECIAYKCGHDCGDAFSERFAKNMIKSEEKGLSDEDRR